MLYYTLFLLGFSKFIKYSEIGAFEENPPKFINRGLLSIFMFYLKRLKS